MCDGVSNVFIGSPCLKNQSSGSKKAASKSGGLLKYFKPEVSFPMSTAGGNGVADENNVTVTCNSDGSYQCVSDNHIAWDLLPVVDV